MVILTQILTRAALSMQRNLQVTHTGLPNLTIRNRPLTKIRYTPKPTQNLVTSKQADLLIKMTQIIKGLDELDLEALMILDIHPVAAIEPRDSDLSVCPPNAVLIDPSDPTNPHQMKDLNLGDLEKGLNLIIPGINLIQRVSIRKIRENHLAHRLHPRLANRLALHRIALHKAENIEVHLIQVKSLTEV